MGDAEVLRQYARDPRAHVRQPVTPGGQPPVGEALDECVGKMVAVSEHEVVVVAAKIVAEGRDLGADVRGGHAGLCVCARVRACVRVCVCVCV